MMKWEQMILTKVMKDDNMIENISLKDSPVLYNK